MIRKIIVAGGLGMLGRILCPWLTRQGFHVIILTRNPASSAAPPHAPAPHLVHWDGITLGPWACELDGAAALINLAGRSVNCRYTPAHRREILHSRVLSTRALAQAIARCRQPPPVWLNSSTATIYRHTFGPAWDENGEIAATREARDAFSIEVATAWERAFFSSHTPAVHKIALRTAIVLAHDRQNMISVLYRLVRLGLGGPMGHGRQWVSWVHAEDFCRAIAFLINQPASPPITGPVNIAAPNPLTNREMMNVFRELCRRPFGLPAPRWLLEVGAVVLRTETELVIKSRRVIPGKLLAAGFVFQHPDFREALVALLHAPAPPLSFAALRSTPSSCVSLPLAHEY